MGNKMIYLLAVRLWNGRAESRMTGLGSGEEMWLELSLPESEDNQGAGVPGFDYRRAQWFRLGRTVDSL
jgi:hypothetical protein